MDKFAQRRGLLNKLHEWGNVSGKSAEKFFNPEFLKVMTALRLKDDNIRSILAGEKIGDGDPGRDKTSAKQLLKSAKSNLNRREYMLGVSDLGRFHSKLLEVANQIHSLNGNVNAVHEGFLFKHLTDEGKETETPEEKEKRLKHLEHLKDLRERFAAGQKDLMIKEASIADLLVNMGTQRGRALAAWEKRYKGQTQALKDASNKQLDIAEKILELTLAQLKIMASYRAARNVDEYMKAASKITTRYETYDVEFKDYYTKHIKGFLEKMFPKDVLPTVVDKPGDKPVSSALPTVPDLNLPASSKPAPELPPDSTPPGGASGTVTPVVQTPAAAPVTVPASAPANATVHQVPDLDHKTTPTGPPDFNVVPSGGAASNDNQVPLAAHSKFYATLEKMSGEKPLLLKSFISTYAKKIAATDPSTSIQLLNVVKSIKV